jgi:hypothetical protein
LAYYNFTPYLLGFKVFDAEGNCREVVEADLTEEFNASCTMLLDIYNKIFPDEELRLYFFKIISTGLSGRLKSSSCLTGQVEMEKV